jgi:hypothetical protein
VSQSNIIGFYDKADRNLGRGAPKCRLTAFTAKEFDKWQECVPYFQYADACFRGYTGFPRYGVCVDVRMGDFLAMEVHDWHCNTPLKGISKDYTRLSVVCYLRENMYKCKDTSLAESMAVSNNTMLKKQENIMREKGYITEDNDSGSSEGGLYNRR